MQMFQCFTDDVSHKTKHFMVIISFESHDLHQTFSFSHFTEVKSKTSQSSSVSSSSSAHGEKFSQTLMSPRGEKDVQEGLSDLTALQCKLLYRTPQRAEVSAVCRDFTADFILLLISFSVSFSRLFVVMNHLMLLNALISSLMRVLD